MEQPLPAERQRRILELLRERRAVRVSTLAELLGVSEVTIRRDLEDLERRDLLERAHGGAILAQRMAQEPPYTVAVSRNGVTSGSAPSHSGMAAITAASAGSSPSSTWRTLRPMFVRGQP